MALLGGAGLEVRAGLQTRVALRVLGTEAAGSKGGRMTREPEIQEGDECGLRDDAVRGPSLAPNGQTPLNWVSSRSHGPDARLFRRQPP